MSTPEPKEEICCCCGHKLGIHIPETEGWRCHCLGSDGYQCECFLRYGRYPEGLVGYSLERRAEQFIEELKKESESLIKRWKNEPKKS